MLGFICALDVEVEGIKNLMTDPKINTVARITYYSGTVGEKEIVCCECGIGKVNAAIATQIMIDLYHPAAIVNSGVAGSLSRDIAIGDIVISTDCVQHDMDGTEMGDRLGEIQFNDEKRIDLPADKRIVETLQKACADLPDTHVFLGRIASGDVFVASHDRRQRIADIFGALACEMEGGAVGHTCYRNGVPYAVLRCISDDFNQNELMDYMQFRSIAAEKSIHAITRFIELM